MIQKFLHNKRLRIIRKHLKRTPSLDIGAGKNPKADISLDLNKDFRPDILADVQHLPIRDEIIDSIVCSHVIEHVKNLDMVMNEIGRIMKTNGIAIFFLPNDGSILWQIVKPIWTMYYENIVSKQNSPKSHVHSLNCADFNWLMKKFLELLKVGKMNLGMEIYACARKPINSSEGPNRLSNNERWNWKAHVDKESS